MQTGQTLVIDLNAHISAGDHDAACLLEDLLKVFDTLHVLDLGDDADLVAAIVIQEVTHGNDIIGRADEGCGDIVHVHIHAKAKVGLILLGQIGQVKADTGDVDALAVGQLTTDLDAAGNLGIGQRLHRHLNATVVDQNAISLLQLGGHIGIGHRHPRAVTLAGRGAKGEEIALRKGDLPFLEGADTDLGALGIQHDSGGLAQLITDAAEGLDDLAVIFVIAVREVEACHVHARSHHFGHDPLGF